MGTRAAVAANPDGGTADVSPLLILTEVEKTRCQLEREHVLGTAGVAGLQRPLPLGLFVPECDEHGNYVPTQCHGSTGYCWCVDRDGRELEGTRTRPGMRPPCKLGQRVLGPRPQTGLRTRFPVPVSISGGPYRGHRCCFLLPSVLRTPLA